MNNFNKLRDITKKFNKVKEKFEKEQIKYCDEYSKAFVEKFNAEKELYNFYGPLHIAGYMNITEMEPYLHLIYDGDEPCVYIKIKRVDDVVISRKVKISEISQYRKVK